MKRRQLLDQHINPFLTLAGFQPWNMQTPLYLNWFLPEKVGCSESDLRRGGALPLLVRASSEEYVLRLESLLQQAKQEAEHPQPFVPPAAAAAAPLHALPPVPAVTTAATAVSAVHQIPEIILQLRNSENPLHFSNTQLIRFGRDEQAQLNFKDDKRISKQQGCISWDSALQMFRLLHLGRNPTVVDGISLEQKGSLATLKHGSVITIGERQQITVQLPQAKDDNSCDTEVD
jgi:hypothetical protein